ncbi:unnamed protein product [Pleuronectes platessa]|uniref:Uncharacterized protein n=1 Tax=Pleuronectes platessa TaxID=8262 RepID=A0A9N7YBV1_PLEPL|nr:unnamed protein product [Pleuronectes platessa]
MCRRGGVKGSNNGKKLREQLCESPAGSEDGTGCLATGLPLAHYPPLSDQSSGPRNEEVNGGEKHNKERERTQTDFRFRLTEPDSAITVGTDLRQLSSLHTVPGVCTSTDAAVGCELNRRRGLPGRELRFRTPRKSHQLSLICLSEPVNVFCYRLLHIITEGALVYRVPGAHVIMRPGPS